MFFTGKKIKKYVKAVVLGSSCLVIFAGGQAFASEHILNNSQVVAPSYIIVAQTFEEQREQHRRDFEEQSRKMNEQFDAQVKRNQEQFNQRVKESNERFNERSDKFFKFAIVFGVISLVVKLLGIYVASKRK